MVKEAFRKGFLHKFINSLKFTKYASSLFNFHVKISIS